MGTGSRRFAGLILYTPTGTSGRSSGTHGVGILGRPHVMLGWTPSGWVNNSFDVGRLFEATVPQSER